MLDKTSIDHIDLKVLDQLQTDASRTNQQLAASLGVSPPTCLRRVQRLRGLGLIEREIAVLSPTLMAAAQGHGLEAIVEVSLDRQDDAAMQAFEARVVTDEAVQQCYRVSPGPDFVLIVAVRDMPSYLKLAQRLFNADANVRNVKAFFSVRRSKFAPRVPI